ncbi:uncharacterized protein B0H64DRAFT_392070 [Chaetomium fimeti]|uniref:Zn(2)-C6 fungal-type domain-containing protein n=1 Tax=Chaetomium fimeti TaxID=1854472 RepID=A0AAE0LTW3_9PEZI|nr:hypothetical protein B0H64DRAFT_392070 [Chaetomium fimeti]
MERRGPSHLGPYGLACTSCFKAKCKCVARTDGEGCQRCHRLRKQCRPSDSIRKRTIEKTQNSASRIAELEGKLDSLISQLQTRNVIGGDPQPPSQSDSRPVGSGAESVHHFQTSEHEVLDSGHAEDGDDDSDDYDDNIRSARRGASPNAVTTSDSPEPQISETEAETLLRTFRSCMLSHFPFVHLPIPLGAYELRCDQPFLFRAIACAASPSAREKAARGMALKKAIGDAMLGRDSESNTGRLDLLLALLTYISWGWDHVLNRGNLPRLMAQANSLAREIRMDGPPPPDAQVRALFTPGYGSEEGGAVTREVFLARQRAVLACFALSSVVSAYSGQAIDALRWTPQMEDGLAAITNDGSCPTDATLAIQVRLQLLAQKAVQIHQHQQLEQGQVPVTELTNFQAIMALTALQTQRQEIQTSLPPALRQHEHLLAHIHATELSISEVTHAVSAMVPIMITQFSRMAGARDQMNDDGTNNSNSNNSDATTASARHERVAYLWQSTRAVQACAAALLAPEPARFAGISVLQWAQLAQCAVALHRLTVTCEDPAWDVVAAREDVHLPDLLGRVAAKLELVAAEQREQQGPEGVFTRLARTMREFCSDQAGAMGEDSGRLLPRLY